MDDQQSSEKQRKRIKKGGVGQLKPADDVVNQLVDRQKSEIIKQICDNGQENCPPSDAKIIVNGYKRQTVSGYNYFISVTIGDYHYHVRIYCEPWTNTERVTRVKGPKQLTDEIVHF